MSAARGYLLETMLPYCIYDCALLHDLLSNLAMLRMFSGHLLARILAGVVEIDAKMMTMTMTTMTQWR